MRRPWQIWLTFAACLIVAVVAFGWLSVKALEADSAQAESRRQAAIEENARLALWRMDSFVAPIIAQENARPWNGFGPRDGAFVNLKKGEEANVTQAISQQATSNVILHFQFVPYGHLAVNDRPTSMDSNAQRAFSPMEKAPLAAKLFAKLPPLNYTADDVSSTVTDNLPEDSNAAAITATDEQYNTWRDLNQLSYQIRQQRNQLRELCNKIDTPAIVEQRIQVSNLEREIKEGERQCADLRSALNIAIAEFSSSPSAALGDVIASESIPGLALPLVAIANGFVVAAIVFLISLLFRNRILKALRYGFVTGGTVALLIFAAALVFGKEPEAVVWLRIARPLSHVSRAVHEEVNYDAYRKTQAARIRSPYVLQELLKDNEIANLPIIRQQQNPRKFLERQLVVILPPDSELIQIKMRGKDRSQLVKIVDAVKNAFLSNVVDVEQKNRIRRKQLLEEQLKIAKNKLDQDHTQLADFTDQLATIESTGDYTPIRSLEKEIGSAETQRDKLQSELDQSGFQQHAVNVDTISQGKRSQNEYQARAKNFKQNVVQQSPVSDADMKNQPVVPSTVRLSVMQPLWLSDSLILARRASIAGYEYIQGSLLNWPSLKDDLLLEIYDLLPNADLRSIKKPDNVPESHQLASLPVILIPGPLPGLAPPGLSPIKQSLLIAWGALFLAALAAAAILRGVISLSERRATFVSAVTHELRTPLTTFRMYAEMLREGMVATEAERNKYLDTLRVEADRLTHLVANVLAYARLERGRPGGRIETRSVSQLLTKATERLSERAAQAQFQLSMDTDAAIADCAVQADPAAVEQILFNLVDNSCKYAASAANRILHLETARQNGQLLIRLRDHGAGVSPAAQRRLFQAFRKSAQEAAQSAPGVGLGLALSRRLARDMHGDLHYEAAADDGACFVLSLPLAPQS